VRSATEIERTMETFAREGGAGAVVLPSPGAINHRDSIIALASRHRLPAVYPYSFFTTAGGLLSYGLDIADLYRRAAGYVDRRLIQLVVHEAYSYRHFAIPQLVQKAHRS
jgi:putative tryptophan/tyrosine transport system substrate-binding protein